MRGIVLPIVLLLCSALPAADFVPVRISQPVDGHIHPAICRSGNGTLVVTYGHINHRDLRITRSTDNGVTWSVLEPFALTVRKTY